MKKYVIGGLVSITLLGLFSYTTTDNDHTEYSHRTIYNIPLKQKRVVTSQDINYVNKLVKQGYVVEFVTENHKYNSDNTYTTYTLIKY